MRQIHAIYLFSLYSIIFLAFSLWTIDGELGDQAFENLAMVEFFSNLRSSSPALNPQEVLIEYTDAYRSMQWLEGDNIGLPASGPINSYLWGNSLAKVLALNILDLVSIELISLGDQMLIVAMVQLFLLVFFAYYAASLYLGRWTSILAVAVFCGDIFLVQLLHSQLEPQLIYAAIIFLAGLTIFLRLTMHDSSARRLKTYGCLMVWAAVCQLNGYPTTQVIIPLYFVALYGSWAICSAVVGKVTPKTIFFETSLLVFSFIAGSILGLLAIGIWFESIRFDFHDGLVFVFSNVKTVFLSILEGGDVLTRSANWSIFSQVFDLLIYDQRWFTGPHQPGMLLGQAYWGYLKLVLFVVGTIWLVKTWRSPISFSFLTLLIVLMIRLSLDELVMIWKTNFDAFYGFNIYIFIGAIVVVRYLSVSGIQTAMHILVSLSGIAKIFPDFLRLFIRGYLLSPRQMLLVHLPKFSEHRRVEFKCDNLIIALVLGALVCLTSSFQFNSEFLGDHNRNLGEWSGVGFIREYVSSQSLTDSKVLVVMDYDHGDELLPNRLFLRPNQKFVIASLKFLMSQPPELLAKKLEDSGVTEVLVISDGSVKTVAHHVDHNPFSLINQQQSANILIRSAQTIPVFTSTGAVTHFLERMDSDDFVNLLTLNLPAMRENMWFFSRSPQKDTFTILSECLVDKQPNSGFGVEGLVDESGYGIMVVRFDLKNIINAAQTNVRVNNGVAGYDSEVTRLTSSQPQYMLKQKDFAKPMNLHVAVPLIFDQISYGELVVPTFFTNGRGDSVSAGVYLNEVRFGNDGLLISEKYLHGDESGKKGGVDIFPRGVWYENALNFSFSIDQVLDHLDFIEIKVAVSGEGDTRILSSDYSFHLALIGRVKDQRMAACTL